MCGIWHTVGHINPTHGTKSIFQTMDRKARQYYNDREKRVAEQMCKLIKCTPEEYQEKKENMEWKIRKTKIKKYEREKVERQSRYEDERRKEESNKRKELIDKGIIKYVKNVGLVNTETGEVVKL